MRTKIIAGNWKLHNSRNESLKLVNALRVKTSDVKKTRIIVCPTFTSLTSVSERLKDSPIKVGAQDMFWETRGAFTGEISADMLLDAGCEYVIIGHSERRQFFGETDDTVNKKVKAGLAGGLTVIVCVGESLNERETNKTFEVIQEQLFRGLDGVATSSFAAENIIIAYEPIWAIGTGKTASPGQAQEVHRFIRNELTKLFGQAVSQEIVIQYGGSVKPSNAKELLSQPDIDGALVGGASLNADDFAGIIHAAESIN